MHKKSSQKNLSVEGMYELSFLMLIMFYMDVHECVIKVYNYHDIKMR